MSRRAERPTIVAFLIMQLHPGKRTLAALATIALLGAACSGSDDSSDDPTPVTEGSTTTPAIDDADTEDTDSPDEDADTEPEPGDEDAGDVEQTESPMGGAAGNQAEWANPVTDGGEHIATIEVGDITVEVFQIGVTQATRSGLFVDPENNRPIIDVGDDIVFVNYVVTNHGDPIDLSISLVGIDATYDDWPFIQGMDTITDAALFDQMGVNRDALATGSFREPGIYTFGTGERYSYGENFRHQPGSPITFDVRVTPVDAEGKLVHDLREQAEGHGEIR